MTSYTVVTRHDAAAAGQSLIEVFDTDSLTLQQIGPGIQIPDPGNYLHTYTYASGVTPDGRHVYAPHGPDVQVYDLIRQAQTPILSYPLPHPEQYPVGFHLAFTPNGQHVLVESSNDLLPIYDRTGSLVTTLGTIGPSSFQVLVGDANGADKAIQRYLAHKSYNGSATRF